MKPKLRRQGAHHSRARHDFHDFRIVNLAHSADQAGDGEVLAFRLQVFSQALNTPQLKNAEPLHPALGHAFGHRPRQARFVEPVDDPPFESLGAGGERHEGEEEEAVHRREISKAAFETNRRLARLWLDRSTPAVQGRGSQREAER
jgi:hypothetical protein